MTAHGLPAASVEIQGLTKDFGANRVLNNVNLRFEGGSIHALLGANGSGKSTLIKILAGYHSPTAGEIRLHGYNLELPATPRAVHDAGIRFVHQDLGLVDSMSVADNLALALGYECAGRTINWRRQREAARRDLAAVGLDDVDPDTPVNALGPVQQTLVAMARAIRGLEPGRGVLVLDEPTARLPNAQVDELLVRCRNLRDQGVALIYVSHRLDEVFAMADRVTVLRDGSVVFDDGIGATNEEHLTSIITGQQDASAPATESERRSSRTASGAPRMALRGLSGARVRNINLELGAGEILAVTGLIGSGRSELGRLIFGTQKITSGQVEHNGTTLDRITPETSIARGIGYVPQDRKQAAVPAFSVASNLCLADLRRHLRNGFLSGASQRQATLQAIEDLDVRPPDPDRPLKELSGGNQQKVILGKWLQLDLDVLILDEPTYGVDIGARNSILSTVRERADSRGLSVLLLDSDIDLVASFADRVVVMRQGEIVKELRGEQITVEAIAAASYAVHSQEAPTADTNLEVQP